MEKRKRSRIIVISIVILLTFITIWFLNFYEFAEGIKNDTLNRNKYLKQKGLKLDSLGTVNYEDYEAIRDSF